MKLFLNSNQFEYDIRGLYQAFFPWEKFETDKEPDSEGSLSVLFSEKRIDVDFWYHQKETKAAVISEDERTDEYEVRSKLKRELKRAVYNVLSEATNLELPWGTLTGIRPTKIFTNLLNEKKSDEEIFRYMEEEYYLTKEKQILGLETAKREAALLKKVYPDGEKEKYFSLYVGIPFCPSTCLYCSFSSYTISAYEGKIPDYIRTLCYELEKVAEMTKGKILHSVYFGGGTPTSVSAESLEILFRKIAELFDLSSVLEWTVEAGRPETITKDKLQVMKKYPVTRISINPQTMHDETLRLIGRNHSVEDVRNAFSLARQEGFTNINMDLILGLPGENFEMVRETLDEVLKLNPDSITVHSLAIKRSSRLNLQKDIYSHYEMKNSTELVKSVWQKLTENAFYPYYLYRQKNMAGNLENVGYCKEGHEGIYNVLIMEETETILACGAGSVSKFVCGDRIERAANVHDVDTYRMNIDEMIERKIRVTKNEKS